MINIQDNIAEISVGNISIGSAYVGNQLVWQKEQDDYDPYDMTDFISGYRLYTNGTTRAGAAYIVTKFYPLISGHSYKMYAPGGSATYCYGYSYKENKSTSVSQHKINNTSKVGTFTAAATEIYFRMTFMISQLANSYIQDTTTGKYLFKGANL